MSLLLVDLELFRVDNVLGFDFELCARFTNIETLGLLSFRALLFSFVFDLIICTRIFSFLTCKLMHACQVWMFIVQCAKKIM